MFWLILCYFLHATGELCLSPIGLSMITKLSPKGVTGILMGTWFLAYSFAQYVAALIAQLTGVKASGALAAALPEPTATVMIYGTVFWLHRLGSARGRRALGFGLTAHRAAHAWCALVRFPGCFAQIRSLGYSNTPTALARRLVAADFCAPPRSANLGRIADVHETRFCLAKVSARLRAHVGTFPPDLPDLADLPEVEPLDPEPVAVAIETARALFRTGDQWEALRWLRRAAERAEEFGRRLTRVELGAQRGGPEHRAAKHPSAADIAVVRASARAATAGICASAGAATAGIGASAGAATAGIGASARATATSATTAAGASCDAAASNATPRGTKPWCFRHTTTSVTRPKSTPPRTCSARHCSRVCKSPTCLRPRKCRRARSRCRRLRRANRPFPTAQFTRVVEIQAARGASSRARGRDSRPREPGHLARPSAAGRQ